MPPNRALLAFALLAAGCFTDQSSSGSGSTSSDGGTTGEEDPSGTTGTNTTSDESSEGTTGTLSSSSSGLGTSPGTTGVEECGEMQACVPTGLPGWSDPMLIIARTERLPGCPAGDLLWRAGQGTDVAMCSCDCTLNGECTAEVLLGTGGTCDSSSVEVIADQCHPFDQDLTGSLSARVSLPVVDDVACDIPPPPGADFETNILACELPGIGDCDAGVCVPLLPGPDTATCIAWEEEGEAPPCPEPFVVARTVFDEIDASALSCDTCDCAPEDLACDDAVATMYANNACAGSGATASEGPCTDLGIAASGVQSVGFQASLTGTCAGTPVAPSGEAALSGERSLCCRR